jgi:molybdopterin synthase sulfur carrier subunit
MGIRVLFFATLADIAGARETTIESAGLSDVSSVFARFARDCPGLEAHRKSVLFAVNSEFARPNTPVHDGDEVAFFPPVSGG